MSVSPYKAELSSVCSPEAAAELGIHGQQALCSVCLPGGPPGGRGEPGGSRGPVRAASAGPSAQRSVDSPHPSPARSPVLPSGLPCLRLFFRATWALEAARPLVSDSQECASGLVLVCVIFQLFFVNHTEIRHFYKLTLCLVSLLNSLQTQ